jgi:hypothetical protein
LRTGIAPGDGVSPEEIANELRVARDDFHVLLDGATSALESMEMH